MLFNEWITIGMQASRIIDSLVRQVERPGHGHVKHELVKGEAKTIIRAALEGANSANRFSDEAELVLSDMLDGLIEEQIAACNRLGEFQHTPTEPERIITAPRKASSEEISDAELLALLRKGAEANVREAE